MEGPKEYKKKIFKDYYQDPIYRQKHLSYIMTKVACPGCNLVVMRCNMSKHRKSLRHIQIAKALQDNVKLKQMFEHITSVKDICENTL